MLRHVKKIRRAGKRSACRRLVALGDAARDRQHWQEAARAYAAALAEDPVNSGIHVQHGHALKEGGARTAAEAAYRAAIAIDPNKADTWVQLGHVLKLLGRGAEAVEAYRQALLREPALTAAKMELVALGAREMIPQEAAEPGLGGVELAAAAATLRDAGRRFEEGARLAAHPTRSFNDFRHSFPVLAPPPAPDRARLGMVLVAIDARGRSAAELKITLESLLAQTDPEWRAHVCVDADLIGHPVASLAAVDPRVAFSIDPAEPAPADGALFLRAGTVLDRHALAWLCFCHLRTGCAAAYSDHDLAEESWREPRLHYGPVFQPQFDPHWFGSGLTPPAMLFVAGRQVAQGSHGHYGHALCDIAAAGGTIVHVPRLLATVVDVETPVRNASPDTPQMGATPVVALVSDRGTRVRRTPAGRISVVIPTRDQADILARAVETLRATTARPDRVEIIVADNRSVEPATRALLARLEADGVRTLPFDEPFNWSRVSNAGIDQATGDHLVLLNNDTEMLTAGWDEIVLDRLAEPGAGIVGARLLYPDRQVQHAGIVLGMGDGSPVHEGVGARESDAGPLGRWLRARNVAAVTGAFMAMRRETWKEAGGFDEVALPLGYNDIDMCLKVRANGRDVLYEPALLLIHHESKTRGLNVTRSQVAWDRAELRALHARWGDALFRDHTLNPHWGRHGRPFDCYREPSRLEILEHVDGGWQPPRTGVEGAADEKSLLRRGAA
jgi:GT2 family glycosyltransferase/tetratricopeptide (TPR) repeat protein